MLEASERTDPSAIATAATLYGLLIPLGR